MEFNQDMYVESTKGIMKEFVAMTVPEATIILSEPQIPNETLVIDKPKIYIEYERDLPIDKFYGRNSGRGYYKKRHRLTYSFQILTQGDNKGVMERDRTVQKLVGSTMKKQTSEWFVSKGLYKIEGRFISSYRVRENYYLARVEVNFIINFQS